MEETMPINYNLMPSSLKRIALIKIASCLWNQADVWSSTNQSFLLPILDDQINRNTVWLSVEKKVIEKVPNLSLPASLNKELINVIAPLGHEILRWKWHMFRFCGFCTRLPRGICWTSNGMVDRKKTAETLIKRENFLDITMCFNVASDSCLENDVMAIWSKMPLNITNHFYNEEDPNSVELTDLVAYWAYFVNKGPKTSRFLHLFGRAVYCGNKVAAEYFLQKLTPIQRGKNLVRIAKEVICTYPFSNRCNSDVVCFLLSQMNENQQKEVFIKCPYEVLLSCLDYPSQSYFLQTANHLWDFLSKSEYKDLLKDIVDKVIHGHKDYNYELLFLVFWKQNSLSKKFDLNRWTIAVLLPKLFEAEFEESIRLILNNATLVKKAEFIFSPSGKFICENLITKEKWYLIRLFICECISSKKLIAKFRKECRTWSLSKPEYTQKLLQLLDDLIKSYDKKGLEEREDSIAKRLRSTEHGKQRAV